MSKPKFALRRAIAGLFLSLALISGCATTAPTIDLASEPTDDDLYAVTGTGADEAWARSDLDMAGFSKILLEDIDIEFRSGGETRRTRLAVSSGGPFAVTDEQQDQFRAVADEEIPEELGRSSRFDLVDEPGPGVLLVNVQLLDLVSYIPPDVMGRSDLYLSEFGEATLILELRDSTTGTLLARTVERHTAEPVERRVAVTLRVTNAAEVNRLFHIFGQALRDRLEEIGSLGP